MKIAIVRLTSLGDIIFCMASLQIIRRRFPSADITWISDSRFADILDNNPDINRIVKIGLKDLKRHFSLSKLSEELDKIKQLPEIDMVIDMHGMIKSAVVSRVVSKIVTGFDRKTARESLSTLLYTRKFNIPVNLNWIYRYASLSALALNFNFDEAELFERKPYLFYSQEDALVSKDYFSDKLKNVVFVAASSMANKDYPKEKFVNIANALKQNVLICHGNDKEAGIAQHIASCSAYAKMLPRMNINQLKAAVSRADLVIGGDTGPTHIAWANNIPSVTILGPTPSHCIYSSPVNIIIKSRSSGGNGAGGKKDFSIRDIDEADIIKIAERLLS